MLLAVKPACKWGSLLFTYLVQTSSKCNVKWLIVVKRESQDLPCSQSFNLWPGQAGKQNSQKNDMFKEKEPTSLTFNFDKGRDGLFFPSLQISFLVGFFGWRHNMGLLSTRAIWKIPFKLNIVIRTGIIERNPMADSFLTSREETGWSTSLGNRDVLSGKRAEGGRARQQQTAQSKQPEAACLFSSSRRTHCSWVTQHYLLPNKQQVSLFAQCTVFSLVSAWHRG